MSESEVVRKTDRQEFESVQKTDEGVVRSPDELKELADQAKERLEIERESRKRTEDRRMG